MKLDVPLGVSAETWYPHARQTVADAIAAGDVDAKTAAELGYTELPVSADVAPPDMAVRAAERLLARTGYPAARLSQVLHASVHHQGHDAWSAPHYVADRLQAGHAMPIGLLQQCNGGAAGIELAATKLLADPSAGAGLVTTADRFFEPSWHRWLTDYGMAAGDVATAVLVDRGPGDLELHAIASAVAADLESMHRGDDELNFTPLGHSTRISVRRTKRAFLTAYGLDRFVKTVDDRIRAAVGQSLDEAGLTGDDPRLRHAVIPRLGAKAMREAYLPPLVATTSAPLLDLGRASGHVGAGDLNANLAELVAGRWLRPGEYAVVLNGGGGFTFTSVVVRAPEDQGITRGETP